MPNPSFMASIMDATARRVLPRVMDAAHAKWRAGNLTSTPLQVSWKWFDESQGVVEWTFTNPSDSIASGVLVRGVGLNNQCLESYVFGGAFFPLYHYDFNVPFTTSTSPLVDNGASNNIPPLGVLNANNQRTVGFVFTLAPKQSWSMLEGGFANTSGPCNAVMKPAVPASTVPSCWSVTYNLLMQCEQYNMQAGTNYPCPPDPFKVTSIEWTVPQVPILFQDQITPCSKSGRKGLLNCIKDWLNSIGL